MRKKLDKPIWVPGHNGPKQITEFIMPDKPKVFGKPRNFEKALQRLKETGQMSIDDFNNTAEMGAFIDFYNQMNQDNRRKRLDEDITEISKFLVRSMTRTYIPLGTPKVIKKKDVEPVVDSPQKG